MNTTKLWDPYADFQQNVFSNGLSVYHNFWNRPWLKVGFVVHSGSFADPKGREGTAHFVEHMVSKNINGISREDAELFFRRLGGSASFGSTGPVSTSYSFIIPAEIQLLQESLDMFGKMLLENFFNDFLERERNVILCEFGEEFPLDLMYDLYKVHRRKMLYEGLIMEDYKGNLGDKRSIPYISKDDLKQFHVVNYVPQNISVVVVGNIKSDELLSCFGNSAFSKGMRGERKHLPQTCNVPPMPKETTYNLVLSDIIKGTAINVASYESFVVCPGNCNMNTLEIFQSMMNRILDDEIRQRFGATYNFGVNITDYSQIKEVKLGGKINPNIVNHIYEIIREGLHCLKSEEILFSSFKTHRLNRYKLSDVNGQQLRDNAMEDLEKYHRIVSLSEEIDLIEGVEFSDVCALADYVADEDRRWTLIERP